VVVLNARTEYINNADLDYSETETSSPKCGPHSDLDKMPGNRTQTMTRP